MAKYILTNYAKKTLCEKFKEELDNLVLDSEDREEYQLKQKYFKIRFERMISDLELELTTELFKLKKGIARRLSVQIDLPVDVIEKAVKDTQEHSYEVFMSRCEKGFTINLPFGRDPLFLPKYYFVGFKE